METAFLKTFVLVVEVGSMAEAARRLGLTPTSVAQQVRALERDFGAALLARAGRTVAPTDAGHQVLAEARNVLRAVEGLRDLATSNMPGVSLRLGAIHTVLHSVVPDLLVRLLQRIPQIHVHIEHSASMDLYDATLRGDIDVALCIHPQFPLPKTIGWRSLRKEPLVVLAPARMARREAHEVLRREPFIRYARTQWGGKQAERYLRTVGIQPLERVELSSLTAIALMVDRGLGVSLVPDADLPLPADLRLARIALPDAVEARHVGVLWLRASPRIKTIRLLLQAL
jgi:DNA-binding transcriptional LysR family regulator